MAVQKTDADLQAYLDALAKCGVRTKAARTAGTTLKIIKRYIDEDETFATAEALAFEEAADFLETCAWDRATEGYVVVEEHENEDGSTRTTKRYLAPSDGLLTTLLKASRPDKFAERNKLEATGKDGAPLGDDGTVSAKLAMLLANAQTRRNADVEDLLS